MKDRGTRVIMANAVFCKGRGQDECVDQFVRNMIRLGCKGRVVVNSDNEEALNDLVNSATEKLAAEGVEVLREHTPIAESQSNGSVENAIKLLKGVMRVHPVALERKAAIRLPTRHPVMIWLATHVADIGHEVPRRQRRTDGIRKIDGEGGEG